MLKRLPSFQVFRMPLVRSEPQLPLEIGSSKIMSATKPSGNYTIRDLLTAYPVTGAKEYKIYCELANGLTVSSSPRYLTGKVTLSMESSQAMASGIGSAAKEAAPPPVRLNVRISDEVFNELLEKYAPEVEAKTRDALGEALKNFDPKEHVAKALERAMRDVINDAVRVALQSRLDSLSDIVRTVMVQLLQEETTGKMPEGEDEDEDEEATDGGGP